jgi:hypothetical protein
MPALNVMIGVIDIFAASAAPGMFKEGRKRGEVRNRGSGRRQLVESGMKLDV